MKLIPYLVRQSPVVMAVALLMIAGCSSEPPAEPPADVPEGAPAVEMPEEPEQTSPPDANAETEAAREPVESVEGPELTGPSTTAPAPAGEASPSEQPESPESDATDAAEPPPPDDGAAPQEQQATAPETDDATEPAESPAPSDATTAEETSPGESDEAASSAEDESEDGETSSAEPAADESASADAPAEQIESEPIVLGTPELTSGIPGDGPLTVADITKWLDSEGVHTVLEIDLPMGLRAGMGEIKGIDDNPMTRAKIELGRQLYFDTRLSSDSTVSCATCHDPDEGFTRHTQFGIGIDSQQGNRNSPVSYNRILSGPQFWDGRAASLEEQAKGPIANPIEMGNTHGSCVKTIEEVAGYREQFARIFPNEGVNIDTIAKAIAAFERAIVTGPAPADYYEIVRTVREQYDEEEIEAFQEDAPELYDKYANAVENSASMSDSARRGRQLFFSDKANCTACHVGANFTDEKYHNLGVGMDQEEPDLGRFVVTGEEKDKGAFKTPTIRNVALSSPYMHDGSQQTLMEVVEWYDKGGHPNPHLSDKIKKLDLSEQDKADLVAYMESLTGPFPSIERARLPE